MFYIPFRNNPQNIGWYEGLLSCVSSTYRKLVHYHIIPRARTSHLYRCFHKCRDARSVAQCRPLHNGMSCTTKSLWPNSPYLYDGRECFWFSCTKYCSHARALPHDDKLFDHNNFLYRDVVPTITGRTSYIKGSDRWSSIGKSRTNSSSFPSGELLGLDLVKSSLLRPPCYELPRNSNRA